MCGGGSKLPSEPRGEFGFHRPSGTLWSWPRMNPIGYDDPTGHDAPDSECIQSIIKGCREGCAGACNSQHCTSICVIIAIIDESIGSGGYCKKKKKKGCYCTCIDENIGPQLIGRVDDAATCDRTCAAIPSSDPIKWPNGKKGVCR
jgi:hypothetical protein